MRTPLFRGTALLTLGSGSTTVLGFVFWVVAARLYPATVVGQATALISTMMLLSGLAQLNLPAALERFLPVVGRGRRAMATRLYAIAAAASCVAGIVGVIVVRRQSGTLADVLSAADEAVFLVVAVVVWTLFTVQDGALVGLRRPGTVVVENVSYSVAKLGLVAVFAVTPTVTGIAVAWVLPAVLLTVVLSGGLFLRWLPTSSPGRRAPPSRRELMRFVSGNWVAGMALVAVVSGTPIVVAERAGSAEAAYFFIAWTIVMSVQMLVMAGASAVTVEAAVGGGHDRHVGRAAIRQAIVIGGGAALLLLVFAGPVLSAFGGEYREESTTVLRVLVLGIVPNAIVITRTAILRAQDRTALIAIAYLTMFAVGIGGAIASVGSVGIEGAAVAWTVAQYLTLGLIVAGRREERASSRSSTLSRHDAVDLRGSPRNVHNFWDRGLLGMALRPELPATPYVYVLYTYDARTGGSARRWGTARRDTCPTPPGAHRTMVAWSRGACRGCPRRQRDDRQGAGARRGLVPAVPESLDRQSVRRRRRALRQRRRRRELQLRRLRAEGLGEPVRRPSPAWC